MTTRLEAALVRLDEVCGGNAARTRVERVELGRDGALLLTLRERGSTRWFADTDGGLRELQPGEDPLLPLCARVTANPDEVHMRVLSWRPGRRIVLAQESGGTAVVVKGFRAGREARAAAVHERLDAHGRGSAGFRIPALLAWNQDESSLAMERLEGRALSITSLGAAHYRRAGLALRALQHSLPADDLPFHGWPDELRVLDDAGERVRALSGMPAGWTELRERLDDLPPPIAAEHALAAHRDLHDEQMLAVDGGVALLDYDLFARSSPLLDAANLVVHLYLRALQRRSGATHVGAEACTRAFLEGFELEPGAEVRHELRVLQAASAARLAAVYALRPRWPGLSSEMIRYATRCLDERPR